MLKRTLVIMVAAAMLMLGCDKENEDLVKPASADAIPQVMKLDDTEGGGMEDEDEFSCKITLNDKVDPSGDELSGKVIPLKEDVILHFEIQDLEGFENISDFVKGASAFYEIDDCTTSEDQNIDLDVQLDLTTGKGSVRFPKDVEEVELVFETDDAFFDDNILNTNERSLSIKLVGVNPSGQEAVVVNPAISFIYHILDDEGIHGDWELDPGDPVQFAAFQELFGLVSDDISALEPGDVDKIEISFEYDEFTVKVELKATESVTECGITEIVPKEIEVSADIEELSTLSSSGDIELAGEIEQTNGALKEFIYKGSFTIAGNVLSLLLAGEYEGDETAAINLLLEK